MPSHVEQSIVVDVPLTTAYNQWTQFETFPEFMDGVEEVRQLNDKRLHWRAKVGGKTKEWEAQIVEQTPDRRIAWQSTTGAMNRGVVEFNPTDDGKTEVSIRLTYEPEGVVENVGDFFNVMNGRVRGDLERFKTFIESRGAATGQWRGEIHGGKVEPRLNDVGGATGTTVV